MRTGFPRVTPTAVGRRAAGGWAGRALHEGTWVRVRQGLKPSMPCTHQAETRHGEGVTMVAGVAQGRVGHPASWSSSPSPFLREPPSHFTSFLQISLFPCAPSRLDLRVLLGLTASVCRPRTLPHLPAALACEARGLLPPRVPAATTHSSREVRFSRSRMV